MVLCAVVSFTDGRSQTIFSGRGEKFELFISYKISTIFDEIIFLGKKCRNVTALFLSPSCASSCLGFCEEIGFKD